MNPIPPTPLTPRLPHSKSDRQARILGLIGAEKRRGSPVDPNYRNLRCLSSPSVAKFRFIEFEILISDFDFPYPVAFVSFV